MGVVGFFVLCIIIAVLSGNDDCLSGLLTLGFGILIIVGAFAFNPIIGIIVLLVVINGWKEK